MTAHELNNITKLANEIDIKTITELTYFKKFYCKENEPLEKAITRYKNEKIEDNFRSMLMFEERKIFNQTYQKIYGLNGYPTLIKINR